MDEKIKAFWYDTDFGYVKKHKELMHMCEPQNEVGMKNVTHFDT